AALEGMRAHQPEVAILDVDMPKLDGFAVMRKAQAERLATAIVFLTMHKDEDLFNEALDLGAKGYVLKDSAITDIIGSIKAASRGQNFISPQLSTYLLNRHGRTASLEQQKPSLNDLTPTERRVLRLVAENKTSKEIAQEL